MPVLDDEASPSLLLLDLIDLQVGPLDDLDRPAAAPQLLPDSAAPERLFVRTDAAAWAVNIKWLPALANFLAEGLAHHWSLQCTGNIALRRRTLVPHGQLLNPLDICPVILRATLHGTYMFAFRK